MAASADLLSIDTFTVCGKSVRFRLYEQHFPGMSVIVAAVTLVVSVVLLSLIRRWRKYTIEREKKNQPIALEPLVVTPNRRRRESTHPPAEMLVEDPRESPDGVFSCEVDPADNPLGPFESPAEEALVQPDDSNSLLSSVQSLEDFDDFDVSSPTHEYDTSEISKVQ